MLATRGCLRVEKNAVVTSGWGRGVGRPTLTLQLLTQLSFGETKANREFKRWLGAAAMEPDAEAKAQLLEERSLWSLEGHELDADGRDSDLIESQLKKTPLLKGALTAIQHSDQALDAESFLFLAKGMVSLQARSRAMKCGPFPRHAGQTYRRWQK